MTRFIPKEKLTAYQRWELAAFDEEDASTKITDEEKAATVVPANEFLPVTEHASSAPPMEQSVVSLPTAADIERIHDEAHEQGYSAGYSDGLAEAQVITTQMAALLSSFQEAVKDLDQHIADQLLTTAIEIANQVMCQSLQIRPELLLPIVREAIASLQSDSGSLALSLHPLDAALIRMHMGDQLTHNNWKIIENPALTRGGCQVELGANAIDATGETRWKRIIESMGINQDWLDRQKSSDRSPPP